MQHLGLFAVLILITGLALTIYKTRGGLSATFSQRVANNLKAEIHYSLLFIVTLPLLYVFFTEWFVPVLGLPGSFMWFAIVAAVFQIACTWVPERGGAMTTLHRILTGISGIALLPMIAIIATAQTITVELRYTVWVGFACMLALLVVAIVSQKGHRFALLFQIGYYAAFFTIIILVTYL